VPASLGECRCGTPRPSAAALQRVAAQRAKLPWDVVALLVVLALLAVGGLVVLFLPYGPNKMPKLLGFVDRPRPPAAVTPTPPRPTPAPR
jgi:hypothetical protein